MPSIFKLFLIFVLPFFSFFYLKKNFNVLEEPEFLQKFSTLYQNLYPLKPTVYKMTTIFCLKRIIFSIVTAYLRAHVVPSIYCYTLIPIFSLGFNLNNTPMNSRVLNFIENLNECFVWINGYFLIMFTEWICDPEIRYMLGWIYMPIEILVIAINLVLIFYELFIAFRNQRRKLRL